MSEEKHRRGRPKGTGIDDRRQLQRVAALLAGDPDLKPTTAIKSLGVTDPSIIRRLRDKFHEARSELMADIANAQAADAESLPRETTKIAMKRPARPEPAAARAMPARIAGQTPVRKSAAPAVAADDAKTAPAPKAAEPASQSAAVREAVKPVAAPATANTTTAPAATPSPAVTATHTSADPASWFVTMCGFGIMAASAALEAQAAWASQFVRLPPMAMALRQHIALNELAMTLASPTAVTRASFH